MRCGCAVDMLMIGCIYGGIKHTRNLNKREFLPVLPAGRFATKSLVKSCVLRNINNSLFAGGDSKRDCRIGSLSC